MNFYLYIENKNWMCSEGELPEKSTYGYQPSSLEEQGGWQIEGGEEAYHNAIAALKSKALPVGNPELAVYQPKGLNQDTKSYYFHSHLKLPYFEVKEGEFHLWPGTAEKKEVDTVEDGGGCYVAGSKEIYHLTLPNMKSETSKKIQGETPQEMIEKVLGTGEADFNSRLDKGKSMSNEQLIQKCEAWIKSLCETGGRSWTLRVPVEYDRDPDMLFTELMIRFKNLLNEKS
jgi:hypothetical protein